MKRRWQEKRQAEGKDTSKPNILMGSNAQVALEKFARYFEVEARILPVTAESRYRLDPELVKKNIDENTIGVFVILGSTYTGRSSALISTFFSKGYNRSLRARRRDLGYTGRF